MANNESNFKNMVLTLLVITLISSGSLAFFNDITKEPIAKAMMSKKVNAIKEVLPTFNNDPISESFKVSSGEDTLFCYPALQDGKAVGCAIETFSKNGFNGTIKVMVGFNDDGSIYKALITEHKETPGLGDKLDPTKSNFSLQFEGKNPDTFKLSVKKDGGDVNAITASTISSRAYCDALKRAFEAYKANKKQ